MFKRTTAINKLLALKKRKRVIQGGTWAGKTFGIMPLLIDKASKYPNKKITVVAETIPAIKEGVLDDFKNIMQMTGRWNEKNFNATDRVYKFPATGSRIEFKSFDSLGKAKAAGKRTDLFINEGNYIAFEIADALMMRTSERIWIDFNPTNEFWAHTEVLTGDDAEFLLLKYTDNEALPETIYKELMTKIEKSKTSEYWRNWCKVYIDGEIGSLEGVIFTNWKQIDDIPAEATLIGYGLDFGYTNDPTALVAIYKWNGKRILDEVLYQTGMINSEIAKYIKKGIPVFADSAEPKSIEEIRRHGINIKPVVKGSDSINFGLQAMQNQEYLITSNSRNIIKEFRAYSWDKDKMGKRLNVPIDTFNHSVDAIRYHEMMTVGGLVKDYRTRIRVG
ncbi:terminase large subunit [Flavobacterium coralii]|uniref:PBSX family phage terminase large subunit n=1 Tax=Flavobacterium coralii TaxID=2838017 RepID=UPI000C65EDB6|nr:terminase [Flavobacterium sp.]|tara:strand:- start:21451 stop:22623 length:1173 start_codon:yes stop_codon:yes gene_type:complete